MCPFSVIIKSITNKDNNKMLNKLKSIFKSDKGENIMGRTKMRNSTKFLNAMLRGQSVSWKEANTKYNLSRPRAVVEKLREEGHCIYANKSVKNGTSYRIGKPSKEVIAAGLATLDGVYA